MDNDLKAAKKSLITSGIFGAIAIIVAVIGLITKSINFTFCLVAIGIVVVVFIVMVIMFTIKLKQIKNMQKINELIDKKK